MEKIFLYMQLDFSLHFSSQPGAANEILENKSKSFSTVA